MNVPEVKSAGKSASDGIRALRASYGSTAEPPEAFKEPNSPADVDKAVDTRDDLADTQPRIKQGQTQNKDGSPSASRSSDSEAATSPYQPRGPTRSGSITEQVVDSHGIRKVILETGSSPSDESDKPKDHPLEKRLGSSDSQNAITKYSGAVIGTSDGVNGMTPIPSSHVTSLRKVKGRARKDVRGRRKMGNQKVVVVKQQKNSPC